MRTPLFSRAAGLEPLFEIVAGELNPTEAALLRYRFGFDSLSLPATTLMPFHLKNRLYNEAALRVRDPLVGVRVGLTAADKAFRPLNDFANAGHSLCEVIARANTVLAWHCNVCVAHLQRFGFRARWSLAYPGIEGELVVQHAARPLIQMVNMVKQHGGDVSEIAVEFPGIPVSERHRLQSMLGVSVQTVVGGFAVTFPAIWLESLGGEQLPDGLLPPRDYAEHPLPASLAEAVRSVFEMHGENFDYDVDQVSAELGTSRRMLQYGLTREGVSYRDLWRHERIAFARRMLSTSDAPIADIAAQIGYWDLANFHRAFVGATGQTPGQYREAPRAG